MAQNVWFRLRSSSYCHSSSGMSMMRADRPVPPALQTMMSSCPKWSMVKSTRPSTSAWSVALPWKKASAVAAVELLEGLLAFVGGAAVDDDAARLRRGRLRRRRSPMLRVLALMAATRPSRRPVFMFAPCRVAAGPQSWPWSRECFDGPAGHRFGERRHAWLAGVADEGEAGGDDEAEDHRLAVSGEQVLRRQFGPDALGFVDVAVEQVLLRWPVWFRRRAIGTGSRRGPSRRVRCRRPASRPA